MKRGIHKGMLFMALILFGQAHAQFAPLNGLWWNPDEPGRGIFIEVQDDIIVAAFYHYESGGANQWWLTAGSLETNDAGNYELSTNWLEYSGGQCPGCTWSSNPDYNLGETMTIEFLSQSEAILYWEGGYQTPIERQYWGFDTRLDFMVGAWDVILDWNGGSPEILQMSLFEQTTDYVAGLGLDDAPVYAIYDEPSGLYAIVYDDPSAFSYYLLIAMQDRRFWGAYWVYTDGGSPDGDPNGDVRGYRWASKSVMDSSGGTFYKSGSVESDGQRPVRAMAGKISLEEIGLKITPEQVKSIFQRAIETRKKESRSAL